MAAHDPSWDIPMDPKSLQIRDSRRNAIRRSSTRTSAATLVVSIDRDKILDHGGDWTEIVPHARAAVAQDERRTTPLTDGPERGAWDGDVLFVGSHCSSTIQRAAPARWPAGKSLQVTMSFWKPRSLIPIAIVVF